MRGLFYVMITNSKPLPRAAQRRAQNAPFWTHFCPSSRLPCAKGILNRVLVEENPRGSPQEHPRNTLGPPQRATGLLPKTTPWVYQGAPQEHPSGTPALGGVPQGNPGAPQGQPRNNPGVSKRHPRSTSGTPHCHPRASPGVSQGYTRRTPGAHQWQLRVTQEHPRGSSEDKRYTIGYPQGYHRGTPV